MDTAPPVLGGPAAALVTRCEIPFPRLRLRSWRTWVGAAAIAPLAIGQSGDSSSTRFAFGAGAGTYAVVARGCSGEVLSRYKQDFRDAAVGVEHEFRGPLSVGVRTQTVWGRNQTGGDTNLVVWNPHIGLEWESIGVGVGLVTPNGGGQAQAGLGEINFAPASGHLRIGNPRRANLSFRLMEDQPLYSGGGTFVTRFSMPEARMKLQSSTLLLGLLLHLPFSVSASSIIASSSAREFMKQAGRDTTANEILDSILTGSKVRWRRADLAQQLRHRIHLNVAEVPRFPHDDPRLMDPRNWPASMNIEGGLCSLTVYSYDGHQSTWSRSIEDSGAAIFYLYYTDVGTDFHSHYVRHRGPSYGWLKGRLRQRSWTRDRGSHSHTRSYWPYPSGELFTFMEFDKKYDSQGNEVSVEWIEEVFARDGTLIGCCAGPVNNWGACSGYWLGVDVGKDYPYRWHEALERSLELP